MAFSKAKYGQMWVSLVEKALAKVFGNYLALDTGQAREALGILTGQPCETIEIHPEDQDVRLWLLRSLIHVFAWPGFLGLCVANVLKRKAEQMDEDLLFAKLLSQFQAKYLIAASFDSSRGGARGLVANHAYSILDVRMEVCDLGINLPNGQTFS